MDIKAIEYLEQRHTKEILNMRKSIYRRSFRAFDEKNQKIIQYNNGTIAMYGFTISLTEINFVLAKRPHIPNKIEAKAIRQQRAHTGRNKSKHNP